MKLFNIIVTFLTVSSLTVFAQKSNHPVEVKAEKNIYIYKRSNTGALTTVHRKNSIPTVYASPNSKLWPISNFEYTSDKPISKSLHEIFSSARLKELSAEFFFLNMYLNRSGKITALEYFIKDNTKITPFELEKLETAIKKNASFNLSKEDRDKAGILAPVQQSISLKKVLNGTFPN